MPDHTFTFPALTAAGDLSRSRRPDITTVHTFLVSVPTGTPPTSFDFTPKMYGPDDVAYNMAAASNLTSFPAVVNVSGVAARDVSGTVSSVVGGSGYEIVVHYLGSK